ncbi:MAG: PKD domain-containing protein, partial [Ilumatobacteraceae bacterium]
MANQPPTAAFTATTSPLQVAVDATASTDADGTIASYEWDFGDGGTGTGATALHTYALGGTYTIELTITDDDGATATVEQQVVVPDEPVNQVPTATFEATTSPLQVAVDAATSSDPDGTIVSYAWDFGDGATGTGVTAAHTFAAAGTYTVELTVTDDDGASATSSQEVVVPDVPANGAPTAAFTATTSPLQVAVDAATSSDADGTIVSYAWDFGDGATGSGVTAAHTFAAAGTYTIVLTVTDDDGAEGTSSQSVVVEAPAANQTPLASFTTSTSPLEIDVDASGSSDPDGTIVSYAWDFGDGASGSGATTSHTYAAAGTYTVGLVVTDDDGATATISQEVLVPDQPVGPQPFATDAFER